LAVRIRLTRVGATKRPSYRVVAIDRRRPRDGRALEILGFYDPLTEPATVRLETEKIKAWIGKGAQPSEMVTRLLRQAEASASAPPTAPPKKPASKGRTIRKPKAAAARASSPEAPPAAPDAEAPAEAAEPAPETPAAETAAAGATEAVEDAAREAPAAENESADA
jgi:small subunit ribosomal protein S16